jgi:hypothetical protein
MMMRIPIIALAFAMRVRARGPRLVSEWHARREVADASCPGSFEVALILMPAPSSHDSESGAATDIMSSRFGGIRTRKEQLSREHLELGGAAFSLESPPDPIRRSYLSLRQADLRSSDSCSVDFDRTVTQGQSAVRGWAGWRRERDSNPRWAFDPYTLSRGAPSTTRPSLRRGSDKGVGCAGAGRILARTLQGKGGRSGGFFKPLRGRGAAKWAGD